MTNEKRTSPRYPLQAVDFATMLINDKHMLLGSITNVCRGGIKLELFPTSPDAAPKPGDSIRLETCPTGLGDLLQGMQGTITWTANGSCGVSLSAPVDKSSQELERYFHMANLAPWDGSRG